MHGIPEEFYSGWLSRWREGEGVSLHEGTMPPERWMQQIWRHQRLRRGELRCADGRRVRVLHPGFWNREPGPDFRGAVLQFGENEVVTGDVEIDLQPAGWFGHGHAVNPAYSRVVLQVVWETGGRAVERAVLPMAPFLDCPLEEMGPWLEDEAVSRVPPTTPGRCCGPLRRQPTERVVALLEQAARARLDRKVAELGSRGRSLGWSVVLWEAVFGALGYKHNVWPMRRMAEVVSQAPEGDEVMVWEARLLGLAGLLPAELPRGPAGGFVRSLWDHWWRERSAWLGSELPVSVWRLGGFRPANHPTRRLALAARWLALPDWIQRVEQWFLAEQNSRGRLARWVALLTPERQEARTGTDAFWSEHWTLRSRWQGGPLPWIGPARATDLAINAVLPWLLARAAAGDLPGDHGSMQAQLVRRWMEWPSGQDNADLRFARRRLWGGAAPGVRWTAARQQGLLQVRRDFCLAAGSLCAGCRFPRMIDILDGAGMASGGPRP